MQHSAQHSLLCCPPPAQQTGSDRLPAAAPLRFVHGLLRLFSSEACVHHQAASFALAPGSPELAQAAERGARLRGDDEREAVQEARVGKQKRLGRLVHIAARHRVIQLLQQRGDRSRARLARRPTALGALQVLVQVTSAVRSPACQPQWDCHGQVAAHESFRSCSRERLSAWSALPHSSGAEQCLRCQHASNTSNCATALRRDTALPQQRWHSKRALRTPSGSCYTQASTDNQPHTPGVPHL
jgi:hypothetical protein